MNLVGASGAGDILSIAQQFQQLTQGPSSSKPHQIFLQVSADGNSVVLEKPGFLYRNTVARVLPKCHFGTCAAIIARKFAELFQQIENGKVLTEGDKKALVTFASWFQEKVDDFVRTSGSLLGRFSVGRSFAGAVSGDEVRRISFLEQLKQAASLPTKGRDIAALFRSIVPAVPLPGSLFPKIAEVVNALFQKTTEGIWSKPDEVRKASSTVEEPIGKTTRSRNLKVVAWKTQQDSLEFSIQASVGQGKFKTVFAKAVLENGSWQMYAYAKKRKDVDTASLEKTFAKELRFAALTQDMSHVIVMREVKKRKDPSQTKGLLMEFCPLGDLEYLGLDPSASNMETKMKVAIGQALGIAEIHKKKICHLDVKPSNFLISTSDPKVFVKLADFGFAALEGEPVIGCSILYAPPEQLDKKTPASPSMDIYALGVSLICLFYGTKMADFSEKWTQWKDVCSNEEIARMRSDDLQKALQEKSIQDPSSKGLNELLKKMICVEPKNRPTADQVVSELTKLLISL
jgi:serine/threonine protein kinase